MSRTDRTSDVSGQPRADQALAELPQTGRPRVRRPWAGRRLFETGLPRSRTAWTVWAAATVLLAVAMGVLTAGDGWHGAVVVCFALAAPLLIWVDLLEHRLPDLVVLPLLLVLGPLTVVAGLVEQTPGRIGAAALGAGSAAVLFLLLFLASPGSLGLGDVKLAPSVGLLLGWHGWQFVVLGLIAILVLGCVHGLVQAVVARRIRGVDIAFGPAMLVAALAVCALVSGV